MEHTQDTQDTPAHGVDDCDVCDTKQVAGDYHYQWSRSQQQYVCVLFTCRRCAQN